MIAASFHFFYGIVVVNTLVTSALMVNYSVIEDLTLKICGRCVSLFVFLRMISRLEEQRPAERTSQQ